MPDPKSPLPKGLLISSGLAGAAVSAPSFPKLLSDTFGETAGEAFGKWLNPRVGLAYLIALGCCVIAAKLLKPHLKYLCFAIGFPAAQAALFLYASFGAGKRFLIFVPDLIFLLVGIVWLVIRPGRAPLYLLIAYEAASLVLNVYTAYVYRLNHEALIFSVWWIVWKALTIVALIFALKRMKLLSDFLVVTSDALGEAD